MGWQVPCLVMADLACDRARVSSSLSEVEPALT